MPATYEAVESALKAPDLSRVAIAKPLYGTTRMHYTVLWDAWGPQRLQDWHRDWRRRGMVEANGNGMVKSLVAAGTCHLGLTDTDDFYAAKDTGAQVAMLPVRIDDETTIVVPNTVSIVKGTKRLSEAKRLVDYLLSEETELALANSASRQVPLGPVDTGKLSGEVKQLMEWRGMPYPSGGLGPASRDCLAWLRKEYLGQ
jgi:iron(III) transport system substrate-binding protein